MKAETIHLLLDALGTLPVIGEPADALNAVAYAVEGDLTNAGISAGAMIPIIGDTGKVARYACSFTGDTPVLMADGTQKPISQVKVGDQVQSTDPDSGEHSPAPSPPSGYTTTPSLTSNSTAVLPSPPPKTTPTTTPPIRPGNGQTNSTRETNSAPPPARRCASPASTGPQRTTSSYNLSVAGVHTYHVVAGNTPILVHNECPIPLPTQVIGPTTRLTNTQATDLAVYLGYKPTNFRVKGQKVFTNGKTYIVQDIDSHIGSTWKLANSVEDLGSKKTRTATTDALLNEIGK